MAICSYANNTSTGAEPSRKRRFVEAPKDDQSVPDEAVARNEVARLIQEVEALQVRHAKMEQDLETVRQRPHSPTMGKARELLEQLETQKEEAHREELQNVRSGLVDYVNEQMASFKDSIKVQMVQQGLSATQCELHMTFTDPPPPQE